MNEDKYYTPEIQEFHIGFMFEYKTFQGEKEEIWESMSVGEDTFSLNSYTNPFKIKTRVKYLDGDDIMSLGFEVANDEGNTYKSLNKLRGLSAGDDRTLFVQHECFRTPAGQMRINTWVWWQENRGTEITVFEGSIKNKSEFRKLLKQIHANTITKEQ